MLYIDKLDIIQKNPGQIRYLDYHSCKFIELYNKKLKTEAPNNSKQGTTENTF